MPLFGTRRAASRSGRFSDNASTLSLDLSFAELSHAASRMLPRVGAKSAYASSISTVVSATPSLLSLHHDDHFDSPPSTPEMSSSASSDSDSFHAEPLVPKLSKKARRHLSTATAFSLPPRTSSLDTPPPVEVNAWWSDINPLIIDSPSTESFFTAAGDDTPVIATATRRRVMPPVFELDYEDSVYSLDSRERIRLYASQLAEMSRQSPAWWVAEMCEEAVIGCARAARACERPRRIPVPAC